MFNRKLLKLVIVSTLLFLGCHIKGRVVDKNGTGIDGVTLTLKGAASMTTTTDRPTLGWFWLWRDCAGKLLRLTSAIFSEAREFSRGTSFRADWARIPYAI